MPAGQNNKIKEKRHCARDLCGWLISHFMSGNNIQGRARRLDFARLGDERMPAQSRTQDTNQTCHRKGTGRVSSKQACPRV